MTAETDRLIEAYLWDPRAPAAPEVEAVERRLAAARFDAARRPLALPADSSASHRRHGRTLLAVAASVVLLIAGLSAFWSWRWSWQAGTPWAVTISQAPATPGAVRSELRVNRRLELSASASARVDIARIGTMRVDPGSSLTLEETTERHHRVLLDRGRVSVRIWAPPGRFAFRTPAGSVIDLGCIFDLSVDPDGTSRVRVDTGWVQLWNDWGESLIPAGAGSVMTAAARPGVPIYDDASAAFVTSVRSAEQPPAGAETAATIEAVMRTARRRDVLTLLMLANASPDRLKRPLLERAAQLWPPPPGVTVDGIVAGDKAQLWRWHGALDLPPVKSWMRNWRDALPWRH